MKILVTGGSGYLGTHVRRFFEADDFSRRSHLDILNALDVRLVAEYDVVIHMAAFLDKDPDSAEASFQTNAEGTANVARHMSPGSVLIYCSTKDVYGPYADNWDETPETCLTEFAGQSALEWSKLIGEKYVDYYTRQRNVRACILRLSNIYAPATEGNEYSFVNHYIESVKSGTPVRLAGGGAPIRDLLHVDDLSAVCRAFIDSDRHKGLFNIGGGRLNALSLRALLDQVESVVGKEALIDPVTLPNPVPQNYVSDLSRAEAELGWFPRIGIEEGLKTLL